MGKVTFNHDAKFDIQLDQALIDEMRLGAIFAQGRIELKSESYLWEETGNICIEVARDGKPTGLSTTEADVWIHELKRDGDTLLYLLFPVDRLKHLCRDAWRKGRVRHNAGDRGRQTVVLLKLADLLK